MCSFILIILSNLDLHLMQVLDMPVESYFDRQLFKNKIWVGTVEGLELFQFQSEIFFASLLCPNTLVGCNFDHI